MYLSTPDAHCLGPIKLQLPEPQTNLQAALGVLKLHHSKVNTTKVNSSQHQRQRKYSVDPVPSFLSQPPHLRNMWIKVLPERVFHLNLS